MSSSQRAMLQQMGFVLPGDLELTTEIAPGLEDDERDELVLPRRPPWLRNLEHEGSCQAVPHPPSRVSGLAGAVLAGSVHSASALFPNSCPSVMTSQRSHHRGGRREPMVIVVL
eukprot:3623701-Amphidinium_carterae.2